MLSYLDRFSESFYIAIILWPVAALICTVPLLLWQYRRRYQVTPRFVAFAYLSVLYGLGLVAFTLYPLPDNPASYCLDHSVRPQLVPFQWIPTVLEQGRAAALQVALNFMFFLPLGVFARNFFGFRIATTLALGLLCSLFLETAQLTGLFGAYPCSYRLFDVDDLVVNSLGAGAGYPLGRAVLRYRQVPETTAGSDFNRRVVGLSIDVLLVYGVSWFCALVTRALSPGSSLQQTAFVLFVLGILLSQGVVPYFGHGQTLGGAFVGLTLDTRRRTGLHRLLFYVVYVLCVLLVTLVPPWGLLVCALGTALYWYRTRTMPYELVDRLWAYRQRPA